MSSFMMKIVSGYLRLTQKPRMNTVARAHKAIAREKTSSAPPSRLTARHDVSSTKFGGFTVHSVTPRGENAACAVIYLHGGAYISEIAPQHWSLISKMVDAGMRVDVPIYGLAPQHSYRDAYAFVSDVYRALSSEYPPESISIMGDSAGAGLALGFVQTLHAAERLRRLVLISPWLDLTLSNSRIPAAEKRDPWLSSVGLVEAGKSWAAGDAPTLPKLSPINGPLDRLPVTDVYIGTHDLFYPDVAHLRSRAAAVGIDIRVVECPGAVHVYPLVPVPEAKAATESIVRSVSQTNESRR